MPIRLNPGASGTSSVNMVTVVVACVIVSGGVVLVAIRVPGSAGLFARRYGWSLVGSFSAALAIAAIVFRNGVAVDPLVAGAAAPILLGLIAIVCIATYAVTVWASLSSAGRS